MPPSHNTLQNICHTYMAYIGINKWSCKIIQDVIPAVAQIKIIISITSHYKHDNIYLYERLYTMLLSTK